MPDNLPVVSEEETLAARHAAEVADALMAYEEVREMGASQGWIRMVQEMQKKAKEQRVLVEDSLDRLLRGAETVESREAFRHQKSVFLGYEFAVSLYREIRERAIALRSS